MTPFYISPNNEICMKKIVKLYKTLSDSSRLRILKLIENDELCVCEITEILGLATSTVSKHLSILSDSNLIKHRKDGRWINYQLNYNIENNYYKSILITTLQNLDKDEVVLKDKDKLLMVDRMRICGINNES